MKQGKHYFWKNIWKNRALLLFVLPGLTLIIMFNYVPMAGLVLAFKNYKFNKGIWGSDWCGLNNIRFLFMTGDTTWRIFRNTVGYYFLFRIIGTIADVSLAIALNECRNKYFAKVSQTIMIMPTFISFVAVSFILRGLLADKGIVNSLITMCYQT
ncbi:MAG: hypothetical protein IJ390_00055 [Lachnospiraceae bacterium]|nr:hypothetical protein [Lachnospiraceae bacterium]